RRRRRSWHRARGARRPDERGLFRGRGERQHRRAPDDPERAAHARDPRRQDAAARRLGAVRHPAAAAGDERNSDPLSDRVLGALGPDHRDAGRRDGPSRETVSSGALAREGARADGPARRREGMKKGPSEDIERLRQERLLVDAVTGLPLRTPWDFRRDRVAQLGIVYLQLGRCGASESVYGWELYDGILRLSVASLKEDLESSALKARLLTMLFNGCDGFYLLFDLTNAGAAGRAVELGAEASRLKKGLARRVRQSFVGSPVSL